MRKLYSNKAALILAVFLIIAFTLFQSSNFSEPVKSKPVTDKEWPGQQELRRTIWKTKKLLVIYATGNAKENDKLREFTTQISKKLGRIQTTAKADTQVTHGEISTQPIILVGKVFQNNQIQKLITALPFHFGKKKFTIGNLHKSSSEDVCLLTNYPNPLNRKMPISILTANTPESLLASLSDFDLRLFFGSEFRVFRANKAIVIGFFKTSNGTPWEIDSEKSINYLEFQETTFKSDHYNFKYIGKDKPGIALKEIAQKQEDRIAALLHKFNNVSNAERPLPKIDFLIYESAEDKGLMTGNTDLSHFNADTWEIHAIRNNYLNGLDFFSDTKMLLTRVSGKNKNIVLTDGIGIYFSIKWMKFGYRHWVKTFYESDNINSLKDLFNPEVYKKESYLFMRALAGSFTDFLIHKYEWPEFLKIYQEWPATGFPEILTDYGIEKLQGEWLTFIQTEYRKSENYQPQTYKKNHPVFQKGFCYAHEGYQIYNGYLSEKGQEALSKLTSLGTNWISITPFGYLNDKNKPDYFHYSSGPGSENDESVITAAFQAKELGMGSMLKPHILMNSFNFGWPGDVKMKNKADWQAFFKYYKSWIRHYALLAEVYNFDMFCIGTELMHSTKKEHQNEWRALIRSVRGIYTGPITYASNWWQEFEQIEFWDELDYIGMNCYYPLSKKRNATLEDLKKGVKKILPLFETAAKKYNKPIILTEIGFTSTAQNWKSPHERNRGAAVNLKDQELCYNAVFEVFKDKPWFYGFYWWKWPTYLEYGGATHSGFTPNGKPAEKVVADWYGREWNLVL